MNLTWFSPTRVKVPKKLKVLENTTRSSKKVERFFKTQYAMDCHELPIELLVAVAVAADYVEGQPRKKRARNEKRDQQRAIEDIMRWSEPLFRRAFRIGRADFVALRESCKEHHRQRNKGMAELSSGSMVQLETKMFVTLRTLAGAAYIDLLWYGLPINHIPTYVKETVSIFNKCSLLDTIRLPRTEDEVDMIRAGWVRIAKRKFGVDLMDGHTLLAGDGQLALVLDEGRVEQTNSLK